jgi:hypothetical protein
MAENAIQRLAPARRNALQKLIDVTQGASNSAASTVSAPVDAIAWALRKAGAPIGDQPFGGSDWMRAHGLTAEPQDQNAGYIGEALGSVMPTVVAAKAPQIAGALVQAGRNLAAPTKLGNQAGVFLVSPNKVDPKKLAVVKSEMERLGPPTIRAYWDGEKYIALEGSHRAAAAKELGMTPNIKEVNLRQWMTDHDFPDVKQKASTNRLLDYLEYGNHNGAVYNNFEDL